MLVNDKSVMLEQGSNLDMSKAKAKCFSLLISIYKKESAEYLALCLQSVFEQTLKPTEIILVLDGMINDELKKVVEFFSNKLNINAVGYDENKGLGFALNFGLTKCRHELVARIDADDICLPERFEKQIAFMKMHPNVDICGSYARNIDEKGNDGCLRTVPIESSDITRLIWSCPIIHPSVMFKKSKILAVGNYDVNIPHRQEDYELWIRAIRAGLMVANLDEPLIKYRIYSCTKNDLSVACNRFKIGFSAVKEFDNRFKAYLSLFFPIVRLILPNRVIVWLKNKYDPRAIN